MKVSWHKEPETMSRKEKSFLVLFLAAFFMPSLFCLLDVPVNMLASTVGLDEAHLPMEIAVILAVVLCVVSIVSIDCRIWIRLILIVGMLQGLVVQLLVIGVVSLYASGLSGLH